MVRRTESALIREAIRRLLNIEDSPAVLSS
jgi:hypothetical protein